MSKKLSPEEIAALAELDLGPVNLDVLDFEPDHEPKKAEPNKPWLPDLNSTQLLMFHDPSDYILAHGERGSGKSVGVMHKMIRHCYENWDALAIIVTPAIRAGKLGIVHDLETLVLPDWQQGIGLEWLPARQDPNTKDRILKVANRFGGWSTIIQISIPHESQIASRFKNLKPSFIMVDELTDLNGEGYFYQIIAELKRRRNITGPKQYVATCNPKGKSHWVYKVFFERPYNSQTGQWNPKYKTYHVPFTENAHRPEMTDYMDQIREATAYDKVAAARWVTGEWADYEEGETMFSGFYVPARHVVGNVLEDTGLNPITGFTCYGGYDLGQFYSAAILMQFINTSDGEFCMVFDEIVHLRQRILYITMAQEVIESILLWNNFLSHKLGWDHIADDSAVTQHRPNTGSYDASEFQKEFNFACLKYQLPEMIMRGCPKGPGSVSARVSLVQGWLKRDALLVSDRCTWTKKMLANLKPEEDDPMKPKKTVEGLIHVFDALSYPILYRHIFGAHRFPVITASRAV